jgi:anti-anti-sigma regulatory factor
MRHGTTGTQVVGAAGNLCETRVLQVFHRRCEGALSPTPRRVVLDLAGVTSADTKLVAALVLLLRRADSEGVPLELVAPARVRAWIALCQLEHLLRPACT